MRAAVTRRSLRELWDIEWGSFTFGERIYGKTSAEAADELEALLAGSLSRNARVFDAGCGFGRSTGELARRNELRLTASDISFAALGVARTCGIGVIQSDVLRIPIHDRSVDVAYAHGVIHYVESPETAVRELARIVKPGGAIAFSIWPPLPGWAVYGSRVLRALCAPLPIPVVRALACVLAPFHAIIHRLSRLRAHRVGLMEGAHIMFNMLTAPYLQHADRGTVTRWLEQAGCKVVRFASPEVRVLARKSL
jgi:SAM-dependent methyltransferase